MPFLPLLPELDQLLMPFQTMDRRPGAHYIRKNLSLALALAKLRSPPGSNRFVRADRGF